MEGKEGEREGGSKERRNEGKKQGRKNGERMKAIFIRIMRATNKLFYYLTLALTITFEESILLNVPRNIK